MVRGIGKEASSLLLLALTPLAAGQRSLELELLLGSLEASVSELGAGVDELNVDSLKVLLGAVVHHTLPEGKSTLLGTGGGTLEHEPVVLDNTILDEATHGGDALLGKVGGGGATLIISSGSNAVDLLVHLATVEVSVLTGAGDSGTDAGRVPASNTGDLAKTTVGLTGEAANTPTGGHTLITLTLGDADDVDVLVLGKDRVDIDGLLEKLLGKVHLVRDGSTVDLDLADVGLLDAKVQLADLGVGNHTDDGAELLHPSNLLGESLVGLVLLAVLGEGLLLGLVPVLVHAPAALLTEVLGEDGGEGAESTGGGNVANNSDDHHLGGLHDGDSVNDLLLVHKSSGTVDVTDDVGHASLVAHEGGQVAGLAGIILGEGPDASAVVLGTSARQELEGSRAGGFKLTMRHS